MPKPGKDETQEEFISRCIPVVLDEGTASNGSQAAVICHSIWDEHKNKEVNMNKQYKMTEVVKGIHPDTGEEVEYIRKFYSIDKAKDVGDRTLEFIMSDEQMDRDGEVILLSAWKLKNYATPVVLYNHERGGDSKAIAKIIKVWKDSRNKQIRVKMQFPEPSVNPDADTIYQLYKGGYQFGVSPGFIPNRKKMIYGDPSKNEPIVTYQEISDWFELSLVTVPANPRAVVQLKSIDGIKQAMEDGVVDELEINSLEMFINEGIKKAVEENEEDFSENLNNINNNDNDFDSEVIDKNIGPETLVNNDDSIVIAEDTKIKLKLKEVDTMTEVNKEVTLDEAIEKALTRIKAKEEAEKQAELAKNNEEKAKKWEEFEKSQKEGKPFDMENLKMFGEEKKSNIEVVEDGGKYKGFELRAQGRNKGLQKQLGLSDKEYHECKKAAIDLVAPYSRRPEVQAEVMKGVITTSTYSAGMPQVWYDGIMEQAHEASYFGRCMQFQLDPQKIMHIPADSADNDIYLATETGSLTMDSPSAADRQVTAKKYGVGGKISVDALASLTFDALGHLSYKSVNAVRQGLDYRVFNGDSGSGGGFTGILGNATTTVLFGENNGGTSYASMKAKNWSQIRDSLTQARGRTGAEFYFGKGLIATIETLTYGPSATGTKPVINMDTRRLAGYPFNESEQITDTDATSTMFGCFCNLQNYALAAEMTTQLQTWNGGSTEFFGGVMLWKVEFWAAGRMIHPGQFVDFGTL